MVALDDRSATHVEDLSGHVGRFVRGEIKRGLGDFLRTPNPANRYPAAELLQRLLGEGAQDRRIDQPGRDRIYCDPGGGKLCRERPRETVCAGLRRDMRHLWWRVDARGPPR
jgi:hypothetical protein